MLHCSYTNLPPLPPPVQRKSSKLLVGRQIPYSLKMKPHRTSSPPRSSCLVPRQSPPYPVEALRPTATSPCRVFIPFHHPKRSTPDQSEPFRERLAVQPLFASGRSALLPSGTCFHMLGPCI